MPSGQFSAGNLTRAGGDRYADKRAMLAVIRAALESSLLDAEIRRFFNMEDGQAVTMAKRRKMAKAKSGAVYDAMIASFIDAATRPLERMVYDGVAHTYKKRKGGLNFGGVVRMGLRAPVSLDLSPFTDRNEICGPGGVAMYRRATYENGLYLSAVVAPGDRGPWLALGWFVPWYAPGGGRLLFGPVAWSGGMYAAGPHPSLGSSSFPVEATRMGTKSAADDVTYCWAYRDTVTNEEKRVTWRSVKGGAVGTRFKVLTLDGFWCELNGVEA